MPYIGGEKTASYAEKTQEVKRDEKANPLGDWN